MQNLLIIKKNANNKKTALWLKLTVTKMVLKY